MNIRLLRLCALWMVAASLAACASGTKLAKIDIPPLSPNLGRVYFYRTMFLASTIRPSLRLNGERVGYCKAEGVFFRDVSPGTYRAVAGDDAAADGRTFALGAGEEKFLRCSISADSRGHLQLVIPEEAREEIRDLAYTGKVSRQGQ